MDLTFSPQQTALRARVDAFCAEHCTNDMEAARDRDPAFPGVLHRALGEAGLLAVCLPAEHGGSGGGAIELCILFQHLGRRSSVATNLCFVNGISGALIALAGTEAQKREVLPAVAAGR